MPLSIPPNMANQAFGAPERLTRIILLAFTTLLVLELPLYGWFMAGGGKWLLPLNLTVIMLLLLAFWLHVRAHRFIATLSLCLAYWGYFMTLTYLMGTASNSHFFLLFGAFSLPFMFSSSKRRWVRSLMAMYGLGFLGYLLLSNYVFAGNGVDSEVILLKKDVNEVLLALMVLTGALFIHRNLEQHRLSLARAHQRNERLISNMLPRSIAERLKRSNRLIADSVAESSVVFADIQGFSELTRRLPPQALVSFLNDLYSRFDEIATSHGLEKIKTVGDEYMAVAGAPLPDPLHADHSCYCALALRQAFFDVCKRHQITTGIRIGIASGPVIAGVIGKDKYSFDVWGDGVNLAARLQQYARPNHIQLAAQTAKAITHPFRLTPREAFDCKGFGRIHSYWLEVPQDQVQAREMA